MTSFDISSVVPLRCGGCNSTGNWRLKNTRQTLVLSEIVGRKRNQKEERGAHAYSICKILNDKAFFKRLLTLMFKLLGETVDTP